MGTPQPCRHTVDKIASMPNDVGNKRIVSLTTCTITCFRSQAQFAKFFRTVEKKLLVDKVWEYILPGNFETYSLEREFGCYREMSGGTYLNSFAQKIICNVRLWRLKLFHKLRSIDIYANFDDNDNEYCSKDAATDEEFEFI